MSFTVDPQQIKRRFLLVAFILGCIAFYVLLHYFVIMIRPPGPAFSPESTVMAGRGAILDSNGRTLALQTRMEDIGAWRPDIISSNDADKTMLETFAEDLAPLVDIPADEIKRRIENSPTDFLYIKKQVDQRAVQQIQALRAQGRLYGIVVNPVLSRVYPEKKLAAQIIGFTNIDNNGRAGIEASFNEELAPKDGKNGNHVVLTIDTNVQHILEDIAGRAMEENKASAAMLLAMDPRTGDILGSANLPGFDLNNIKSTDDRMNWPASWNYEPGSVFKVFSVAALLDSRSITPDTVFVCNGQYTRGSRITIKCMGVHGAVNAGDIIVHSCNAGAAYASDNMSAADFAGALMNFGFGSITGAGVPGEAPGIFRPVNQWSERSRPTVVMGQEISVSALQILQASTAIANGGILVPPRLVSRVVSDDGKTIREYQPAQPRRVLGEETAQNMLAYMRAGTEDLGIGRFARIKDVALGVKTGTAQVYDPAAKTYSETDYVASCLAMLPAENPSLVLYMVLVRPMGNYYFGSRTAAPAIREAAEALIDYLGIPRGRNPQEIHPGEVIIPLDEMLTIGDTVPDFRGRAKRSLVSLLLRDDLKLRIHGEGWVVRQDPPPGTPFERGMTIILELE